MHRIVAFFIDMYRKVIFMRYYILFLMCFTITVIAINYVVIQHWFIVINFTKRILFVSFDAFLLTYSYLVNEMWF